MRKSWRYAIEARVFAGLLRLSRLVPRAWLLRAGSCFGWLGYILDRRRRRIGLENLLLAFGDVLDERAARRTLRRCWEHFGRITADTLAFYHLPQERLQELVEYEGLEHIRRAYASNRGVLLFSGHFGHWELTAMMQGFLGLPLALVARPLDNPRLEALLARMRGRSGNRIIHKRQAVRDILRALRARIGVAIVIDQDARSEGIFVPFFGRPASTTPTLALLALRTGAVVVPTFSLPLPGGRYRIIYQEPVEIGGSGQLDDDVRDLTTRCTEIIEARVREHPELWLWMHRRWKTRPTAIERVAPRDGAADC